MQSFIVQREDGRLVATHQPEGAAGIPDVIPEKNPAGKKAKPGCLAFRPGILSPGPAPLNEGERGVVSQHFQHG